jgi:putative methionine-R-sulfoxide reductase with GAF domain
MSDDHHPPAPASFKQGDRASMYATILEQCDAILDFPGMDPEVALMMGLANVSSILFYALNEVADPEGKLQNLIVNWCGFYLATSERKLTLGPFQGKVACMQIPKGKGVCGTAWEKVQTQVVPDVHKLANHIACDSQSQSEIVVPIVVRLNAGEGKEVDVVAGVIDIDSTQVGFFTEEDRVPLEKLAELLSRRLTFPISKLMAPKA